MQVTLPSRTFFSSEPGSDFVRLEQDLTIVVGERIITVKAKDEADGNTLPPFLEWWLPRYGWALEAGMVHDDLPRSIESDRIHREIVIALGKRSKRKFVHLRAWVVFLVLAFTIKSGLRARLAETFGGEK